MAGTLQPIAALTVDDHGPINTIVSIVLSVISVLIAAVRMAMWRRKRYQYKSANVVFVLGLCFSILTSISSHFCVRAGLGRHQETLDESQVVHYFKIFWTTQMLGVITLALAKLYLVLVFQHILPRHMLPRPIRWLLESVVAVYILLSLFLTAFQCQLPEPWKLTPKSCNTHGNVYYPITISNMLTDAMIAFWTFPVIWGLQMEAHRKRVILWIFGSRFLICVVDVGRMLVIRKALQLEDQTRSQLIWAVMDQIVVHLSINHTTLPDIHNVLSSLHTGGMSTHMGASRGPTCEARDKAIKVGQDHLNEDKVDEPSDKFSYKSFAWDMASTSEERLWQQDIELSTITRPGKGEVEQGNVEQGRPAATSSSSMRVIVQTDIRIRYEDIT